MKIKLYISLIFLLFLNSCKVPLAVFHWKKNGVRFVIKKKANGENAYGYPNHGFASRVICFDESCRKKSAWMDKQKHMTVKVKDYSKAEKKKPEIILLPKADTVKNIAPVTFNNTNQPTKNASEPAEKVIKIDSNTSIEPKKILTFKDLNFETGTSVISLSSKSSLDSVIKIMKGNPQLKIHITGHTDHTGTEKGNLKLSWDRAEAVSKQLNISGIQKDRIKYSGMGSTKPLTTSVGSEDRKKNRRVEFYFIEN